MSVLKQNSPHTLNGIVLNFTPCYSMTQSDDDLKATAFADDYLNQWYIKPIIDGLYPEIINQLPQSHQPDIHKGDMALISQSIDYLGINFYTRQFYKAHASEIYEPVSPKGPLTDMGWEINPQSFTDLLVTLNQTYNLPPIYITENGAAMPDHYDNGEVHDLDRLNYYNEHLNAVHNAVERGVAVHGYFAWSLMDNFEWAEGYLKRFGIVYVDYKTQQRTIKKSGLAYKALISNR
jgi:beta-glucosidase